MFAPELTLSALFLFGLWFLSTLLEYTDHCYIWQLKEYRLDRMRDYFSTHQGRAFWLNSRFYARAILAFSVFFWPAHAEKSLGLVILGALILDLVYQTSKVWRKTARFPRPTPKAILLVVTAISLEISLLWVHLNWTWIFFFLVIRFFVMTGVVMIGNQITTLLKNIIISQATAKLACYPDLIVIGITGSYGKSAVKEYASQILASKYPVVRTPGNINTDIGVAKFILKTDFSKAHFFVVEMGAYRCGEIKKICNLVKPKAAILTAIIEQHLSLFGSLKNIQSAKYELLRSVPADGLVIVNGDNAYCTELLPELTCKNWATFGQESDLDPAYLIGDVSAKAGGVEWTVTRAGQTEAFQAPLWGAHQAFNLTPAIIVAERFGLTLPEIKAALTTVKPGVNALKVYKYKEATIIDDTYNSNPKGFKAALDILSSFSSKNQRVVITRGMLELAETSAEYHTQIGEEIAFCADELVIISPDSAAELIAGIEPIKNKFHVEVKTIYDPIALLAYLEEKASEPVTILLENRLPASVLNHIRAH